MTASGPCINTSQHCPYLSVCCILWPASHGLECLKQTRKQFVETDTWKCFWWSDLHACSTTGPNHRQDHKNLLRARRHWLAVSLSHLSWYQRARACGPDLVPPISACAALANSPGRAGDLAPWS